MAEYRQEQNTKKIALAEMAKMAKVLPLMPLLPEQKIIQHKTINIKHYKFMAHFTISNGIDGITGALKKTTPQGVGHITVTKRKHFHDPLTGEETGTGPNEIFVQNKRDYDKNPLTPGEKRQRGNWQQACRDAQPIIRDKSHPRFMELYNRWKEHLKGPEPHKQFPPFVRTVLLSEQ